MTKRVMLAAVAALLTMPAFAHDYGDYPAPAPGLSLPHSAYTGRAVVIPPYRGVFPVKVYTTPQLPPYYNVPPYLVVTPY
jgi:hypothetical protein